jgi:hypothetical protein
MLVIISGYTNRCEFRVASGEIGVDPMPSKSISCVDAFLSSFLYPCFPMFKTEETMLPNP